MGDGTAIRPAASGVTEADLVALLLADKRSAQTRRAYSGDLRAFFGWMSPGMEGAPGAEEVRVFCARPTPEIAIRLVKWKAGMLEAGLAEATVNRRLAAVRSMLKLAARIGVATTDGRGLVEGERAESYRDTRGIGLDAVRRLLRAPVGDGVRQKRDRALLRLLCENALRRSEASALDVSDFDPEGRRLLILGKGHGSQKAPVTISTEATRAIREYLAAAGHADGALFRNASRGGPGAGGRLTADGIYGIVRGYGRQIGVGRLAPHMLRHGAITAALDATGGDVRRVQRLSRHAKLDTLMRYDDNRTDMQGEVSGELSQLYGST